MFTIWSSSDKSFEEMIEQAEADHKKNSPSGKLATIHREQWADWQNRFQPYLERLAGYADSGELTDRDVNSATTGMHAAFDGQEGMRQRQNQGLGIQMSAPQRQASDRAAALERSAGVVGARNQARVAGQDRDMQILAGGGNIGLGL